MMALTVILAIGLSYLVGSVPTGYLIARYVKGIDIRSHGSGNIGATNVWRTLGPGWGLVSLAGDTTKGIVAVLLGRAFGVPGVELLTAAAALAGHGWSVFLRFQGGKIIATSLGVLIMLPPVALATAAAVWIAVMALTRYVSLASIIAVSSVPLAFALGEAGWRHVLFGFFLALVAVYKHRANIDRLLKGKESKFSFRR
jgi:glycerol-3-phosphate acyltransferase PlsY